MAVRLSVKVSGGEHADVGVGSTDIEAKVRGTRIGVSARNGVRIEAAVAAQPSMEVGSGAVCVYPEGEVYQGPYRITPTLDGFGLDTASRFMASDMAVNPIPISEVTNESHGYTVTIG